MKVLILAGGYGTRLAEETDLIPKPMVEVGDRPILLHIMHHYAQYGFTEFVITLGYKGTVVKRYMLEYEQLRKPLLTVNMADGKVDTSEGDSLDWTVHLLETGLTTQTGGRLRKALPLLGDETFMLTYGDGVSNVDLNALTDFHRSHGRIATLTVVRPTSLFGHMEIDGDRITQFAEKPQTLGGWINGGFMVLDPGVADFLTGDDHTPLEHAPLEQLAAAGELMAYHHEGFWQCMDSLRDKRMLQQLWDEGSPPWRTWE